jgi:hypothetical protein
MFTKFWLEKSKGKSLVGKKLDVEGSIILKWIFRKYGLRMWIRLMWFRIGASGKL